MNGGTMLFTILWLLCGAIDAIDAIIIAYLDLFIDNNTYSLKDIIIGFVCILLLFAGLYFLFGSSKFSDPIITKERIM